MSKIKGIGLIVEDKSDFDSLKVLIKRVTKKNNIKFRKAISNGCGKLRRKASSYAINLHNQGCDMIILVHDLDRNELNTLKTDLEKKLTTSPAKHNFICIPVEEIEAWFLGDLNCIKTTFNLRTLPKIEGVPETIKSPKEKIEDLVWRYSNKSKIYLNTEHNEKLSANLCLESVNARCKSFRNLNDYLLEHRY